MGIRGPPPPPAETSARPARPLPTQAGLAMLARGGNAVDAAVATAITLAVVAPVSNGIGPDLFAIVWGPSLIHISEPTGPD